MNTDTPPLPVSIEAEKAVLGAILSSNAALYECEEIDARCFSLDAHRQLYSVIAELIGKGRSVDIVTLMEELRRRKLIDAVGGSAYVADLTSGMHYLGGVRGHARIVRDKSMLRQVIRVCETLQGKAYEQSESAYDLVAEGDSELLAISAAQDEGAQSIAQQSDQAFEQLSDTWDRKVEPAVSTAVSSLDRIICGYRKRRLYVIGGRPSMGKTSLMAGATIQHCARGIRTRLVSLEMTSVELLQRMWAAMSEIPYARLVEAERLTATERKAIQDAKSLTSKWPLEIDDRDGQTIDQIMAKARISCRRRKTGFVAVDYLQNVRFIGKREQRYQEVSDAARALRQLAKDENIPVLLLSSLTEGSDKDPNRRPTLGDLRQSGDIQYHADCVVLIHRERLEDGATIATNSELIVAKQRGGRTGRALSRYNTDTLLFEDPSSPSTGRSFAEAS